MCQSAFSPLRFEATFGNFDNLNLAIKSYNFDPQLQMDFGKQLSVFQCMIRDLSIINSILFPILMLHTTMAASWPIEIYSISFTLDSFLVVAN